MRTRLVLLAILLVSTVAAAAQTVQLTDGGSATPWLAIGASQSAVVWQQDQSFIQAAVLDRNGSIANPRIEIGSALPVANPRVAAVVDTFLVAWQDITPKGTMLVRAALFDASGVLRPAFTITSGLWQCDVVVAAGNGRFLVIWNDGLATRGEWINPAGVVESTFDFPGSGIFTDALVSGDRVIAVSNSVQSAGLENDLTIAITAVQMGQSASSHIIARMPGQSGFGSPYLGGASIASSGSGYYVAWRSGRSGREDVIEGTRLALDLTPLDVDASQADGHHAGATNIQTDYTSPLKSMVRASAAGDRFFVSWIQSNPINDKVRGRYIETNGTPSGYVSFPQPPPVSAPYDTVVTGTTTLLQNGAPISAWTMTSGKLFVRAVGGAPKIRAARR